MNNCLEQDHRGIKQRYYPMLGFGSFAGAARFCPAFDELRAYFRPRTHFNERVSLPNKDASFRNAGESCARCSRLSSRENGWSSPVPRYPAYVCILKPDTTVRTPADARERVDGSTCRSVVDVWQRVLTAGCAIERRQLASAATLQRALSVYGVIAAAAALPHAAGPGRSRPVLQHSLGGGRVASPVLCHPHNDPTAEHTTHRGSSSALARPTRWLQGTHT